ncbi:o-methyltransferase [Phlyctema vagabunda]|uniref:O-methyltransferase n=1 Tax=Phlyctema vagabunda TaxID=108571 RepID=A0ABR4PHG3_9HELO
MPDTKAALIHQAERLLAAAKDYNGDRKDRVELMKQTELLHLQLEDPMDSIQRQWAFMNTAASLNVMVENSVFAKMPVEGSIKAKDLATEVKLDASVIVRLMRILVANGIVDETGEDTFAHTDKSRAYLEGSANEYYRLCINMFQAYLKFPQYFNTHTAEDLIDLRKTPYSYAYDREGLTFYEVLTETRERFNMFNKAMMAQEASLPTLGMFPFTSLTEQVRQDPTRDFVVDIGGGRGQSLLLIRKETGDLGAKMILQDRPQVLDSISEAELPNVEKMAYDFYTPQPIKNAHVYFLRRILHNYQDDVCIKILANTAAAMGSTSRLLIGEVVVPTITEVAGDMSAYAMDAVMIAIGGKERSEKDFSKILQPAGLELVKIWPASAGNQAIIEAKLKGAS